MIGIITPDRTVLQWRNVFYIAFGALTVTNIIYIIFGTSEKQLWDDPMYKKHRKFKENEANCN